MKKKKKKNRQGRGEGIKAMIQQVSRSQSKEPRGCEAHGDEAEREEERKTSIQPWIRELPAAAT